MDTGPARTLPTDGSSHAHLQALVSEARERSCPTARFFPWRLGHPLFICTIALLAVIFSLHFKISFGYILFDIFIQFCSYTFSLLNNLSFFSFIPFAFVYSPSSPCTPLVAFYFISFLKHKKFMFLFYYSSYIYQILL